LRLGYGLDDPGFESRQKPEICFSKTPRPTLGPSQPYIHWVPGFFPGVKLQGCKVYRLFQLASQVKNEWSYAFTPQYAFMTWTRTSIPFLPFTFPHHLIFNLFILFFIIFCF
jgi:hypothetical protein